MIVLHAAWIPAGGKLAIWAEEGSRPGVPPSGRSDRAGSPKARRPRPHPFATGEEGIGLAIVELAGFGARDAVARASRTAILLSLPEGERGPVASPWLEEQPGLALAPVKPTSRNRKTPSGGPTHPHGGPDPEGGAEPTATLARWIAPALLFSPAEAAELVLALPDFARATPSTDPSGVVGAYDLNYAARSAELVLELLTRGRLLPTLEKEPSGWFARWRPLIDARDRGRIEMLLWALPGSFASARLSATTGSPHRTDAETASPADVLRTWMWSLTDALGRLHAAQSQTEAVAPGPKSRGSRRAVAETWTAALRSADGRVEAGDDDLLALSEALNAWNATVDTEAEPVRTCFRIVPPPAGEGEGEPGENDDGSGTWRVEFALQALDDPSLVVPAGTVWADGPELVALERHVPNPDEHLLRGLGRAARLVPSIGSSLVDAEPFELRTDAAGALGFLRDSAPLLEQAGFGVLAPPWWRSSRARIGLRLKSSTPSPAAATSHGLGLDALCEVSWEAALGDHVLSMTELKQLAKLKQPLVRIRGQWVELREGDIAAAIAAVGKKAAKPELMLAGEVLRAALGLGEDGVAGHLAVETVDAEGWLGDLLAGAEDRRLEPRATPEGFSGELRPYQERGLGWLSFLGALSLGACLADDMGLGKTAQLLALVQEERRTTKGPTLVICPMSLVGNWQREAARFTPELKVYVHHGSGRLDDKAFIRQARKTDLVLSTYSLASRDRELLSAVTWNRLVLDEAQQIKNSAARTTQSVRSIPASRRIAMTGTPVENRLGELWSIMQFLNPGLLGSEKRFRERFAIPIERNGDEAAAESLRRITAPFVLRRLKTDRSIIADLPDKLEMKEYCNLTHEQATLYQAVVDDMLARIDESEGIERRGLVLAAMLKLKQVCNHPAHFLADGSSLAGRSGKLARLTEVLDEAASEGDKALVFTQFAEMGTLLERHLQRQLTCDVFWLHGGVGKTRRDAMVEHFQAAPGPGVFLLSLKAGGTGLNLTAATHVVHFDRWWNPAVEDQATDRAFRIGQRRNVQVRKFVCAGTLEERIDEMIESKRALAQRIVGTGEGWITEMSTAQLREVVSLSANAVAEDR